MNKTKIITSKGNSFKKVKSKYILRLIFKNLKMNVFLDIIRYNKYLQNRLNMDISDYKKYLQIVIEIIPIVNVFGNFINVSNNANRNFYHIYFNDNEEEEIKRNYITEEDNVGKIKVAIDYEIKNLYGLFRECNCVKKLNFIQFNRKVNEDMSYLFARCPSIEEINFDKFITSNVTNMSYMFYECSSLIRLNLSNFNTKNVTNMRGMFSGCKSLNELIIENIDINNVTDMINIFNECHSLPSNIKCSEENKTKIINFGYKRFFEEEKTATTSYKLMNFFKRDFILFTPLPKFNYDPCFVGK